jgi:hypothetical protein
MELSRPPRSIPNDHPIIQRPVSTPTFGGWGPRLL